MLHVVDQIEQSEGVEYKNQIRSVLKSNKEKVDECYNNVIQEVSSENNNYNNNYGQSRIIKKRRCDEIANPGSPSGVIDAVFGSDGSID